jgi:hypothetical protein
VGVVLGSRICTAPAGAEFAGANRFVRCCLITFHLVEACLRRMPRRGGGNCLTLTSFPNDAEARGKCIRHSCCVAVKFPGFPNGRLPADWSDIETGGSMKEIGDVLSSAAAHYLLDGGVDVRRPNDERDLAKRSPPQ